MRPWDSIISDEEQRAYHAAGFGRPSGLGTRPALLIIDVQYRTVGTTPLPFWEAIKEFSTSCGDVGWDAVRNIQPLLARSRVTALKTGLTAHLSGWDSDLWQLANWYREG